jgi:hypothetical protein
LAPPPDLALLPLFLLAISYLPFFSNVYDARHIEQQLSDH